LAEKEIRERMPLTRPQKNILGKIKTEDVKDLYNENYRTRKKLN
jgi:hypothetical protein